MTQTNVKPNDLKLRIKDGQYSPSPEAVAKAMLKRPGLRLLFGVSTGATAAGHSQTL